MKKIFVTSTGTEVGKTLFVSGLIKKLKQKSKVLKVLKPVISGFDFGDVPNDISLICDALGENYSKQKTDEISLYKFAAPLSPDQASEIEKRSIDFSKLLSFCNEDYDGDFLVIEGIGGHQVPLTKKHTIMDLISALKCDLNILVAGSYLGCLSHTISAIKNFESERVAIDLLVVTENLDEKDELYIPSSQTIASLKNFFSGNILEIERKSGNFNEVIEEISKEIEI